MFQLLQCTWPLLQETNHTHQLRALFIADTHLLGYFPKIIFANIIQFFARLLFFIIRTIPGALVGQIKERMANVYCFSSSKLSSLSRCNFFPRYLVSIIT